VVAHDEVLAAKSGYLNIPFFIIRLVFYLAVWIGLVASAASPSCIGLRDTGLNPSAPWRSCHRSQPPLNY